MNYSTELEATGYAKAACDHIYGLNRATMWEREQAPSETAEQLADLAALAAALPQAFSQLSTLLEQALETQILQHGFPERGVGPGDGSRSCSAPPGRGPRPRGGPPQHLSAARNATAHIISQGVDDGQDSMTWDQP